jgi:hypothetical protein
MMWRKAAGMHAAHLDGMIAERPAGGSAAAPDPTRNESSLSLNILLPSFCSLRPVVRLGHAHVIVWIKKHAHAEKFMLEKSKTILAQIKHRLIMHIVAWQSCEQKKPERSSLM